MEQALKSNSTEQGQAKIGVVTLFCDVSFCPNTKAAGYGAWYRTDDMEKGEFFGGQVPVACSSSNDGEFWGCALALREVYARLSGKAPAAIVLQCDNIMALGWMSRFHPNAGGVGERHQTHAIPEGRNAPPAEMELAVSVVRNFDPQLRLWLKHVKGHDTKSKTGRSWVNKRCDRLAKDFMSAKRASVRRR